MAAVNKTKNGFLAVDERAACEKLVGAEAPYGQRATVILALDEGATQAQAAERAGLTKGQVRYWSDKFREKGLAIFPEEAAPGKPVGAGTPAVAEEPAAEVAALVEESSLPVQEEAAEKPAADAEKQTKKKKKKGKGKDSAKKKSGKKKKKGGKKGKKKAAKGGKKKAGKKEGKKKGKKKSK